MTREKKQDSSDSMGDLTSISIVLVIGIVVPP